MAPEPQLLRSHTSTFPPRSGSSLLPTPRSVKNGAMHFASRLVLFVLATPRLEIGTIGYCGRTMVLFEGCWENNNDKDACEKTSFEVHAGDTEQISGIPYDVAGLPNSYTVVPCRYYDAESKCRQDTGPPLAERTCYHPVAPILLAVDVRGDFSSSNEYIYADQARRRGHL